MACLRDAHHMAGGHPAVCGYRFLGRGRTTLRWPVEFQRRRDGVHGANAIAGASGEAGPGSAVACALCDDSSQIPEIIVERIDSASLPADWRDISARAELQQVGTTWSQTRASAVLAVPSAVVPAETDYLLNPDHTNFVHVEIGVREEWLTGPRLLRRATASL